MQIAELVERGVATRHRGQRWLQLDRDNLTLPPASSNYGGHHTASGTQIEHPIAPSRSRKISQ